MRSVFTSLIAAFATTIAAAQTQPVPPNKVPQSDGTIQLVPVPPASVYTPYFIDPTIGYQLYMTSDWANKRWNGSARNGLIALKDQIITANILAMPISKTKVVDGKTVYMWSIYRSTDVVVQYDHTRLELLPISIGSQGVDATVMDASKTKCTVLADGIVLFHGEALVAPEKRTPALAPRYYQWNFDGFMWQGAYRAIGKLQFRVKDDYYLPTWGSQKAFIRVLPSTTVNGTEYKTKVDGSPTVGTNVLTQTRSEGEDIIFGIPSEYKVSHFLSAPTTKFKVGDTVKVQIKIKPESKPQLLSSVATNFIWDPTVLELMGMDKTGALPSQSSRFDMPSTTSINESALPKDGNAWHNWLSVLGSRKYLETESVVVTLNFKVLVDFDTTKVEIAKKGDPRLAGLMVLEESSILGSSVPGSDILGTQGGTTINGVLAQ